MPKRACNSMERILQVRGELKVCEVRALWEMTGRLVRHPKRFPTARLERRGVQWLYSLLVLQRTNRVRVFPTVPRTARMKRATPTEKS